MKSFQFFTLALAFASAAFFSGCKKDSDNQPSGVSTVDLEFENQVGGTDLVLNTGTYTTAAGDQFTVSKFEYIVADVVLTKTDGSKYAVPNSYFLVDQATDSTQHITLTGIPAGDYNRLSFVIGLDSTRNVAGTPQGTAIINSDMYWPWALVYTYLRLEGRSPQAPTQPGATPGELVFQIEGSKAPNNCLRTIALPLPVNMLVRTDHHPEIHLAADVLKMFAGPNPVRFATLSTTVGGPNSVKVADNYANPAGGMFSVEHIHAN